MKLVEFGTQIGEVENDFFAQYTSVYENMFLIKSKSLTASAGVNLYKNNQLVRQFTGTTNTNYGIALDIYKNVICIGSTNTNSFSGSLEIYEKESNNDNWNLIQTINGQSSGNTLGSSVAIYEDIIVLGSRGNDDIVGQVFIYKKINKIWHLQQTLIGENAGDSFGSSVAIFKNYLAVGASGFNSDIGKVYIYYFNKNWNLEQTILGTVVGDKFGLTMSLDEQYLSIGDETIKYYLYMKNNNNWQLDFTFAPGFDRRSPNQLSKNIFIAGVPEALGKGKIFAFKKNLQGNWEVFDEIEGETLGSAYGASVSIYKDYVCVGAQGFSGNRGKVYFYRIS